MAPEERKRISTAQSFYQRAVLAQIDNILTKINHASLQGHFSTDWSNGTPIKETNIKSLEEAGYKVQEIQNLIPPQYTISWDNVE